MAGFFGLIAGYVFVNLFKFVFSVMYKLMSSMYRYSFNTFRSIKESASR